MRTKNQPNFDFLLNVKIYFLLFFILHISWQSIGQSTTFEAFTPGNVNYQGPGTVVNTGPPGNYNIPSPYGSLWTVADEWGFPKPAPAFDQEVKDDGTGNNVWRLSNAVTSGSFSFQPCSPSSSMPAGETTSALYNDRGPNHTTPLNPPNARANASTPYFHGGFKFKSATGSTQTGLALSVSPTPRQSSVRMTFLGLVDNGSSGMNLTFAETLAGGTFSSTATIASDLSYNSWHRVDIYIQFVDGLNGDGTGNDIVTIMLNGNVIHTGTTWETFYASASWTSTPDPIAVDALMFRAGGTAAPGTSGNGILFDNVVCDNESLPVKVRVYSDSGETDYINGYSTIQAAIDDATTQDGYFVRVDAGTYNITNTITINKALTINGPQKNVDPRTAASLRTPGSALEAIIDGGGVVGSIFNITVAGVSLNGLEVKSGTGDLIASPAGIPIKTGLSVKYCIVHDAGDEGIQLRNIDNGGVENCLVYSTTGDAINLCCGSTNSGVSNNEIYASSSGDGVIYLYDNGPFMLVNNNLIYNNTSADGIKIGNKSGGNANSNSAFANNAIVSNNIVTGLSGSSQVGIYINTSRVNVLNNVITGWESINDASLYLRFDIKDIIVANNSISSNNRAIKVSSGVSAVNALTLSINQNSFFSNTFGMLNSSSGVVNAQLNWWGDISGPSGSGPGTGNSVSTNVLFCPWLDATPPTGLPVSNVGFAQNVDSGKYFCSIQSAIDDAQTLDGHLLEVSSGTFNEQIIVNKGVIIKGVGITKPIINFTGTPTGKPTLFDVTANNVTIENLQFDVDLSKLKSAIIASSTGLDNITVKDNMISAYGTPLAGLYSDRNAVSVNHFGNTNYRVATGGVNSVIFTGNTVNGTAPLSYFRAGIATDEAGLTATGNTLTTINHDVLLRFASNGANTISNNTFNGGGVELSDQNAGSGTITVSNNTFTGAGAPGTAKLRVKNGEFNVVHVISTNTFNTFDWAVSLENMRNITLNGNTFTGDAATDRHVVVNTKSISSNSNTILQVPIAAVMTSNNFAGQGIALTFLNHDSDNDAYGTFTIGSSGNANTFASSLTTFVELDAQTGTTDATMSFPVYPVSNVPNPGNNLGWPTIKDCWATNLDIQNNTFDVGAGQQAPQAMNAAERMSLEDKLIHNPDVTCLGNLQYFLPVKNVTQNTFYSTIQAGINAASPNDVIELSEWTYNERVVIDKSLTLEGVDSSLVVLTGTGLPGTGSGIHINSGITNVTIKNIKIQNYTGQGNNNTAGIFAQQSNSNLTIELVSVLNNPSNHGIFCANSSLIDNVSITKSTIHNHGPGLRGIVIWDHLKTNITISDNVVTNNSCCGIELQDGDASAVTISNNYIEIGNGDNALGLTGLNPSVGLNVIDMNTITGGGRFGIEIKNPAGGVTVSNNSVSLTTVNSDRRDRAGIAVFRRGVLYNNVDVPNGVMVTGNTVTGYVQNPLYDEGFGIVIEGINHTVTGNTVNNCNVGIQQQGGAHPNANYPGDGLQGTSNQASTSSLNYFGRGNSPLTCGNTISGNTLSSNGINTRDIGVGTGIVVNSNTSELFCSIQSAINDAQTLAGHTLTVAPGTISETVTVTKSLTINGSNSGVNANSPADITMLNGARSVESILLATNIQVTAPNVTIDGFTFTGAGGIHTNGVVANAADGLTMINNVFASVPSSAYNNNSGATAQSNLIFSNNRVIGSNAAGISAINAFDNINSMTMNANYFSQFERGIQLDKAIDITISNNYFTNISHHGLQVAGNCADINITSNVFNNCNTMTQSDRGAIRLYSEVTGDINIQNNIFTNNYNAVRLRSTGTFAHSYFNVNNNSFTTTANKAISDGTAGSTGLINGTCNWYGSTNAVTVASLIEGNVTFEQYLSDGTDNAMATPGFQPVPGSCSGCTSGILAYNTNTMVSYCSFEDAIAAAGPMHTIELQIGSVTLAANLTILSGQTLVIKNGTTLVNPINNILTNNGNFVLEPTGTFSNLGNFAGLGSFIGDFTNQGIFSPGN
jgi:hypothetical protein